MSFFVISPESIPSINCCPPTLPYPRRSRTVIAMQPCELIVIPRTLILPLLSAAQVTAMQHNVAQTQLQRQGRHVEALSSGKPVWPESAGTLREYLQTPPGSRPAWQVGNINTSPATHRRLSMDHLIISTVLLSFINIIILSIRLHRSDLIHIYPLDPP